MPLFDFLIERKVPFDIAVDYLFATKFEDLGLQEFTKPQLGTKIPKSMIDRGFLVDTLLHFEVGYDDVEQRTTIPLRMNNTLFGIVFREYPKKFYTSEGFSRQNFLYNYEKTQKRYYVEGFTDCWKLWQHGTRNVSATLGTKPAEGQLKLMRKHDLVVIVPDYDVQMKNDVLESPGISNAYYIYEHLKYDTEVHVAVYGATGDKIDPGETTPENWKNRREIHFMEFDLEIQKNLPKLRL